MATRLNKAQEEAWERLRAALSGAITVPDSLVLRFIVGEACKSRGIPWAADEGQAAPPPKKGKKA